MEELAEDCVLERWARFLPYLSFHPALEGVESQCRTLAIETTTREFAMALRALQERHTVTVLELTSTPGSSMSTGRSYAPANPPRILKCTVSALPADQALQLKQQGMNMPHKIGFLFDPQINEKHRISWNDRNGMILRVISIPRDAEGMGRVWLGILDAKTEDNPTTEVE